MMSVSARLTDACLHWQRESQRFSPDGEYRGCAKIVGGLGSYRIVYYDSRDQQDQWGMRIATTAAGALLFLRRHCREWHTHKRPKSRKRVGIMKYILVWTREDGSIHVLGTPNGNAFGSFEAAKDGRGRMVARGADVQDISVVPIEGVVTYERRT